MACKYSLVVFCVFFLQKYLLESFALERWSGNALVEPSGINTLPVEWLALITLALFYVMKNQYKKKDAFLASPRQMLISLLLLISIFIAAFMVTHPSDALFSRMTTFIARHPVTGGPFIASLLSSISSLTVIPLVSLIFPRTFLSTHWKKLLIAFFIFQISLFSLVPEAPYFNYSRSFLLQSVVFIASPFLHNLTIEAAQNILRVEGFWVRIGPACSGISFIILFIVCFFAIIMHHIKKRSVSIHHTLLLLIGGMTCLFFLNIVRIASIIIIGSFSPVFALSLFHSMAGAIMFFFFFWIFQTAIYRWAFREKRK